MDSISDGFGNATRSFIEWLPTLVGFLIILVVGWLIAKAISKAVGALLERVGFDRVVERGGVKKALANSNYDASDVLQKIIYWALMLIVLTMAFGVFGPNPISDILALIVAFIPKLIVAIIIIVIVAAIAAAARELITNTLGQLSYGRTVANVAAGFILFLGIIAALNTVGIGEAVTSALLYALMTAIVGILVVGVGGGLIKPMSQRWEGILDGLARESGRIREEAARAPSLKEQAAAARDKVEERVERADARADAEIRAEQQQHTQAAPQGRPPQQGPPQGGGAGLGQQYAQQQGVPEGTEPPPPPRHRQGQQGQPGQQGPFDQDGER